MLSNFSTEFPLRPSFLHLGLHPSCTQKNGHFMLRNFLQFHPSSDLRFLVLIILWFARFSLFSMKTKIPHSPTMSKPHFTVKSIVILTVSCSILPYHTKSTKIIQNHGILHPHIVGYILLHIVSSCIIRYHSILRHITISKCIIRQSILLLHCIVERLSIVSHHIISYKIKWYQYVIWF